MDRNGRKSLIKQRVRNESSETSQVGRRAPPHPGLPHSREDRHGRRVHRGSWRPARDTGHRRAHRERRGVARNRVDCRRVDLRGAGALDVRLWPAEAAHSPVHGADRHDFAVVRGLLPVQSGRCAHHDWRQQPKHATRRGGPQRCRGQRGVFQGSLGLLHKVGEDRRSHRGQQRLHVPQRIAEERQRVLSERSLLRTTLPLRLRPRRRRLLQPLELGQDVHRLERGQEPPPERPQHGRHVEGGREERREKRRQERGQDGNTGRLQARERGRGGRWGRWRLGLREGLLRQRRRRGRRLLLRLWVLGCLRLLLGVLRQLRRRVAQRRRLRWRRDSRQRRSLRRLSFQRLPFLRLRLIGRLRLLLRLRWWLSRRRERRSLRRKLSWGLLLWRLHRLRLLLRRWRRRWRRLLLPRRRRLPLPPAERALPVCPPPPCREASLVLNAQSATAPRRLFRGGMQAQESTLEAEALCRTLSAPFGGGGASPSAPEGSVVACARRAGLSEVRVGRRGRIARRLA